MFDLVLTSGEKQIIPLKALLLCLKSGNDSYGHFTKLLHVVNCEIHRDAVIRKRYNVVLLWGLPYFSGILLCDYNIPWNGAGLKIGKFWLKHLPNIYMHRMSLLWCLISEPYHMTSKSQLHHALKCLQYYDWNLWGLGQLFYGTLICWLLFRGNWAYI